MFGVESSYLCDEELSIEIELAERTAVFSENTEKSMESGIQGAGAGGESEGK